MINRHRLVPAIVIASAVFLSATVVSAQPARLTVRCQRLIESEHAVILKFAHVTSEFQSAEFNESRNLTDGIALKYTYYWHSPVSDKDHFTELTFVFDSDGHFDFVQAGDTSSFFPPFSGSNTLVRMLKSMAESEGSLKNNRQLMKALEMDAKDILESYLKRDVAALTELVGALIE